MGTETRRTVVLRSASSGRGHDDVLHSLAQLSLQLFVRHTPALQPFDFGPPPQTTSADQHCFNLALDMDMRGLLHH